MTPDHATAPRRGVRSCSREDQDPVPVRRDHRRQGRGRARGAHQRAPEGAARRSDLRPRHDPDDGHLSRQTLTWVHTARSCSPGRPNAHIVTEGVRLAEVGSRGLEVLVGAALAVLDDVGPVVVPRPPARRSGRWGSRSASTIRKVPWPASRSWNIVSSAPSVGSSISSPDSDVARSTPVTAPAPQDLAGRSRLDVPMPGAGPEVDVLGVRPRGGRPADRAGEVVQRRVAERAAAVVRREERVGQPARRAAGERAGRDGIAAVRRRTRPGGQGWCRPRARAAGGCRRRRPGRRPERGGDVGAACRSRRRP